MPEGPEIHRVADCVGAALTGQTTTQVTFGLPQLQPFEQQLIGVPVEQVEARGKALLIHFANRLTLYSHNQLYGRWYCLPAGERPDTQRQLRVTLRNHEHSALLYSASEIEVLNTAELLQHPYLVRLGPDLLATGITANGLIERLTDKRFCRRQLGGVLTDQGFVAGIGNYLRCEILFCARLQPARRACDCDPQQLEQLAVAMLELPRRSYRSGGITNDPARAAALMAQGASFEQARFWVFRRQGEACYRCGSTIEKRLANGQPCYLCPGCQG